MQDLALERWIAQTSGLTSRIAGTGWHRGCCQLYLLLLRPSATEEYTVYHALQFYTLSANRCHECNPVINNIQAPAIGRLPSYGHQRLIPTTCGSLGRKPYQGPPNSNSSRTQFAHKAWRCAITCHAGDGGGLSSPPHLVSRLRAPRPSPRLGLGFCHGGRS